MNLFELQKIFADSKLSQEQAFKILLDEFLKQQQTINSLQKQVEDKKESEPEPTFPEGKDV